MPALDARAQRPARRVPSPGNRCPRMAPLGGPRAGPGRARTTPASAGGCTMMRLAAAASAGVLFVVTCLAAAVPFAAAPVLAAASALGVVLALAAALRAASR